MNSLPSTLIIADPASKDVRSNDSNFGLKPKLDNLFSIKSDSFKTLIQKYKQNYGEKDYYKYLSDYVKTCYWPLDDYDRLKQILEIPKEDRGGCFSLLRKNYCLRREFINSPQPPGLAHLNLCLESKDTSVK